MKDRLDHRHEGCGLAAAQIQIVGGEWRRRQVWASELFLSTSQRRVPKRMRRCRQSVARRFEEARCEELLRSKARTTKRCGARAIRPVEVEDRGLGIRQPCQGYKAMVVVRLESLVRGAVVVRIVRLAARHQAIMLTLLRGGAAGKLGELIEAAQASGGAVLTLLRKAWCERAESRHREEDAHDVSQHACDTVGTR